MLFVVSCGTVSGGGPSERPPLFAAARRGPDTRAASVSDEELLAGLGLQRDDTIVTRSARTVDFNGQAVLGRYVSAELSGAGQDVSVRRTITQVVLSPRPDTTLSFSMPRVMTRLRREDPTGGERTLEAEGWGDLSAVLKRRFFQRAGRAETTELAWLAGLQLPTGRDDVEDGGERLPQPLQPGTGATAGMLGMAATRVDGRWLVNADLLLHAAAEGNDYRFGEALHADVGVQWRAYPARYERFDQLTLNLVGEVNARWAEKDTFERDTVDDSGGRKVFFTPGVQLIASDRLLLEAAVQFPVSMALHGDQPEEDRVVILGLRYRF